MSLRDRFEKFYEREDPWEIAGPKGRVIVERIADIWNNRMPHLTDAQLLLDCGCGEGVVTEVIAKRGIAVGVDASMKALLRAMRRTGKDIFAQADIRELPLRSGVFDCITCFETLYYIKVDYEVALREIHRLLKPDGFVVVSVDFSAEYFRHREFSKTFERYFSPVQTFVLQGFLSRFIELYLPFGKRILSRLYPRRIARKVAYFGTKNRHTGACDDCPG